MKENQKQIRIIEPHAILEISKLQRHNIAFPNITFSNQELQRTQTTLKGAYTLISNSGLSKYLEDLNWNNDGDIEWQNNMLKHLSIEILKMIEKWKKDENSELLKKIFMYIQLWGGNTSRGFFIKRNGGFDCNYNEQGYKTGVEESIKEDTQSLVSFCNLNQVGISFATKHMYFWSNKKLPIYDNIIAMIIFGRMPQNNVKHYQQYTESLKEMGKIKNIGTSLIERSIFNWYETENGKRWFDIRKSKLKQKKH
jgi:hypothetical protein